MDDEDTKKRYNANFRNARLLSMADVENHIVDAIETLAKDYQMFEWGPVNKGFERLQELARERTIELLKEPENKQDEASEGPVLGGLHD